MADQDDDLLNYDDSSDAEQDAKIKAFQKKVKGFETIILSPKQYPVEKRREAVRMLGELGEIESIPALVRVYHKDKSPGMKEEAARALGMFKALGDAFFDSDPERQEYAQMLVEGIVLRDSIGQRSRMKRRPLQVAFGGLLVSLALLVALGLALFSAKPPAPATPTQVAQSGPTDLPGITNTPIPTPSDVPGVVALLQTDYAALSSDTTLMRTAMINSTQQKDIACASVQPLLRKPVAIVLPSTITDTQVASVTQTLNTARADLAPIVQAYETACQRNQSIAPADANTYGDTLVRIQTVLVGVPSQLSSFGITPIAPAVTSGPQVTATPVTPTATFTPTPTLDPRRFSRHITGLRQIANSQSGSNGSNTLLRQYWDDVKQSGSTGGCRNLPAPTLPQDYVLPEDIVADAPEELITAAETVNTGLNLSRQSWRAFEQFCADASLVAIASMQYTTADTAQNAFKAVEALLVTADKKIRGEQP